MKKLSLLFVLTILSVFGVAALQAKESPVDFLGGTQQTAEAVTVDVTTYFDSTNHATQQISSTYGTKMSVTGYLTSGYAGYSFFCWIVNGVAQPGLPVDYQFTLTKSMTLVAVFHPVDPLQYAVVFLDGNGKLIELQYVSSGGNATAPATATLSKPGYTINTETPWNASYTNVTADTLVTAQYTKTNASSYTVTVVNGTIGGNTTGSVAYDGVATVVADAAPGSLSFHHWEMQDQTVSYSSTYSFTVVEDTTVTAYYAASAASDAPHVYLTNDLALKTGYKTFIGQFYLPSGYTLVEWGIVTTAAATAMTDLGTSSMIRNKSTRYNPTTKEFVLSIATGNATSYRGYLVCKNVSEELVTVYSENAYNVVNGGFEYGQYSLYGWNRYNIWKDEEGMRSFTRNLVNSETYFGSNPYGRDGNYSVGILGPEIKVGDVVECSAVTWSQSEERMGYLRSSDFTLGGSGWISFKMGGARYSALAYLSIRRTSDNYEVARFGNPNFNNTTLASTQYGSSITNAEAFLFQYYFDLSSVGTLGESYYFLFCDMNAKYWSVISVDSVVSYLPTAPSTTSDNLATNIVPSISTSGADNTIKNGYFATNMDNWTSIDITTSGWYWDSGQYMKSNSNGDFGQGILRSSPFSITPNAYIRFDWAGGLTYDKQIYVSVREVGSNAEVMRYVRRDNDQNNHSNWDNHMFDLSGLDSSKMYYLEFYDNIETSWGVSFFDSIRIITYSEWNGITSGDRAYSITPLPSSYVYTKPF